MLTLLYEKQVAAVVQRSGGIDLHYSQQTLLQGHTPLPPVSFLSLARHDLNGEW